MTGQIFKRPFIGIAVLVWISVICLSFRTEAAELNQNESIFSIGLNAGTTPFISGKAGSGAGAPGYDDLFSTGLGVALEVERPVNKYVTFIAGAGYERYSGKTYEGMTFGNMEIFPFYAGCKIHLPIDFPLKASVSTRIGAAYIPSVYVSWNSVREDYWDSSWVPTGDLGLVLERRVNKWHFAAGISTRYTGAPDNNLAAAEADGFWTVPIYVSISYAF